MNTNRPPTSRRGVKLLGAVCAAAAVFGAGALIVTLDDGGHASMLAGSGDAPTNTVYVQPAVSAMNMGATATLTTPSSVPATTEAVPAIKAGH
jgi:hypothetical protein